MGSYVLSQESKSQLWNMDELSLSLRVMLPIIGMLSGQEGEGEYLSICNHQTSSGLL